MKNLTALCGVLAAMAGGAQAGGLDRSGQPLSILFEQGNYVELSYGQINPSVSGNDLAIYGGRPTGQVADDHGLPGLAFKYQINDRLSAALIYDHAYGADIEYDPAQSLMLGGTMAKEDSEGLTALLRYKFDDRWSVHGGLRVSKASAQVRLSGAAYGPLSGYSVDLDDDTGTGYVIGGAFEIPDIALRVALTYFSKVEHKFDTVENIAPVSPATVVDTPQAVNLDFQTGVAKDTLVFGSVRWAEWSDFIVSPAAFNAATGGDSLTSLRDTTTYTLGVGRKFNDNWSGSIFVTHEPSTGRLVSPLAPTDGYTGIGIGAVYTRDNMKISMGARYLELGNADPETGTPDTARAEMRNNHAVAVGVKVGFTF